MESLGRDGLQKHYSRRPRWPRRLALAAGILLALLALAAAAAGVWVRGRLTASLPQLDGARRLAGLAAPVTVERDALGVPTIRAASREDAARALGFLHAQDRFFQMDLMRRQAAGELAELAGPALLDTDLENRLHRFRAVARRAVAAASPADRALLDAYAAGVNAGLAALKERPFEYLLLRAAPAPWRPEDTILAVHAMFLELNDGTGSRESRLGALHDALPPAMFEFLAPRGSEWDAPDAGPAFAAPPIPGPEVFDLRRWPDPAGKAAAADLRPAFGETSDAGSNNWAVAGAHTADGRALLADDMHLGIQVPNTWYRASIVRPDGRGGTLRVTGVTLPGTPLVAAGSNGHVAWGFTNSFGDWTDLVLLETEARDRRVYRTPGGPRRMEAVSEVVKVKGGADRTVEVLETVWGPVIGEDAQGHPRALAWTAHHPEAVNLEMAGLETARTVDEAIAVADRAGIPPQNFTVADETGRIGWTIIGQMPRRVGFDGRLPASWADGSRRWDGWLAPEEHPRIVDPPAGRIWTANARVVGGEDLAKLGDGGYMLGARQKQIRDRLLALEKATPRDLLAIQLDDRALFLARWRDLLLRTLSPAALAGHPDRAELRRLVETTWTGRASTGSAAYRLVRAFHETARTSVYRSILLRSPVPRSVLDARNVRPDPQFEGSLWRLVTERPAHLLDPAYRSWDEKLLAVTDDVIASARELGPLSDRTWGEWNTTRIRHPLSAAVPFLGRFLDVPPRQLPGDEDMPRVQARAYGASERMVVSPGREEAGIFHMPVGESGHPLSPYYQKGHRAWEEGRPTPFLPGPAVHRLALAP